MATPGPVIEKPGGTYLVWNHPMSTIDQAIIEKQEFTRSIIQYTVPYAVFNSAELARKLGRYPCADGGSHHRLVEDLFSWAQVRGNGVSRCITGDSGVGKSTVAYYIAQRCAQRSQPVLTFFFSRPNPDMSHAGKVVATLAYQLMDQGMDYRNTVLDVFLHSPAILTSFEGVQWSNLIVDTINRHSSSDAPPVVIILDGLDLCSGREEQMLFIALAARSPSSIKVIITCRRTLSIKRGLRELDLNPECFIPLQDDIDQFLRTSFLRIARVSGLHMQPVGDWPSHDVLKTLITMAHGQFSVAAAIIHYCNTEYGRSSLDDILEGRSQAFRRIDSGYLADIQELSRALNDVSGVHKALDYMITFFALHQSHHFPPASVSAISAFCDVDPSDLRGLLHIFDLVFAVTYDSVQFRHRSFLNFLLSLAFPHPYQKNAVDFCSIATRSLRIMEGYSSIKDVPAELIESSFSQWPYQCGSSLPTLAIVFHLMRLDRMMWLGWAVTQRWASVDSGYAHVTSWLESQYFLGWLRLWFPPQLLFDARRQWLEQHSSEVIRRIINQDLRSLYDNGEVDARNCVLLLNAIHDQVLTNGDVLQRFGADSAESVEVLREMLSSEVFKSDSQRFPKNLLPAGDRPWKTLTKDDRLKF